MKRDLALWTGLLAGPVVWAISFLAKFFVGSWICVYPWRPAVLAVSGLALAMTAGAGWLAWSQCQQLGREYPGDEGGAIPRARAMAFAGVLLSAGFAVVLIAQSLPELMLGGCE